MERIMLDKTDRKILFELDKNSRQSFQQLGRKVGLRKETVFQRVKRLQDKKVIEKFQTIVNVFTLDYENYRLFLKFRNINEKVEKKIISFFVKSKQVGWVTKIQGNWDLGIWFLVKDQYLFKEDYELFKQKFANYIYEEKLSIFTGIDYYSRSFLINQLNKIKLEMHTCEKKENLVEKENLILKLLANNSRISVVDISSKVGWSVKTVIKKIKDLEKKKIILGYRLKLDTEKIGVEHYKIHLKLNNLNQKSFLDIEKYIFSHPNIIYFNKTIAGYDLDLDVQVESREDLKRVLNNFKEKFQGNIEKSEVLDYEKEYKQIFSI